MKIVSWNLNGLLASLKGGAGDTLRGIKPDVLCLQEIRTKEEPIVLPDYHHFWNHAERDGYSGTAVLTRLAPVKVFNGFLGGLSDEEGRLITMEYPDFYIVNVYVPNSQQNLKRHAFRLRWDDAFREHIVELQENKPVVICGDFNVAREAIDIYEENVKQHENDEGYASDERSNFETLLEEGLTDVFRALYPQERSYTWWSNRLNKRSEDRGWRLDYFLVSNDLMDSVQTMMHLQDVMGSDHCPILLEAEL